MFAFYKKHNNELYINLVKLSRNKFFYQDVRLKDRLETRVLLIFFHFALILRDSKRKKKQKNTQDIFDNIDEAKDYIKKVEFETPLISLNGKPLNISDIEDKWSYWLNWLDKKNLYSAITEYQNLPYWQNSNGGEFGLNNYVSVISTNKDDLVLQSNKDIN